MVFSMITRIVNDIEKEAESLKAQDCNSHINNRNGYRHHIDINLRAELTPTHRLAKQSAKIKNKIRRLLKKGYEIPYIGYLARLCIVVVKLPVRIDCLNNDIHNLSHELALLRMSLNQARKDLKESFYQLKSDIESNYTTRFNQMDQRTIDIGNTLVHIEEQFTSIKTGVEIDHSGSTFGTTLDQFYVDFENRFRGSRELIKERISHYLNVIKDSQIDYQKFAVLDIGCGRGEWLELMKDEGIPAIGIDLNGTMIDFVRSLGLNAVRADAFTRLAAMGENSLGLISAFHVVEHLPFEKLVKLFDEALRVLTPGGMILFETPNPENLVVGSCNFYTDPSHNNPIPPHTLAYIAEHRGFKNIKIVRSSPANVVATKSDDIAYIRDRFNMAQDYAVIAYKSIVV